MTYTDQLYPEPTPGPCICDEVEPVEELVPRVEDSVVADCPAHADEYVKFRTLLGGMLRDAGEGIVRDDARPTGFRAIRHDDGGEAVYTGASISEPWSARGGDADDLEPEFEPGGPVHVPGTIVVGPEVYGELVAHYAELSKKDHGPIVLPSGGDFKVETIEGVKVEIDYSGDPRKGEEDVERYFVSYDGAKPEGGHALTGTTDEDGFVRFRNTWGARWGEED